MLQPKNIALKRGCRVTRQQPAASLFGLIDTVISTIGEYGSNSLLGVRQRFLFGIAFCHYFW